MIDEDETQRRELSRLLATAKDEDRKELIRKAISALDSSETTTGPQDTFNMHSLNPSIHASLFSSQHMTVETVGSKMRPASARRRPSVPNLLDVIHENHSTSKTHSSSGGAVMDKIDEFILPIEDVAEVLASCFDFRFPPKGIFNHTSGSGTAGGNHPNSPSGGSGGGSMGVHSPSKFISFSSNGNSSSSSSSGSSSSRKGWLSTGLTPHLLTVMFFEKWVVRKIEVRCTGIEKMGAQINASATNTAVSAAKIIWMRKVSDGIFVLDVAEDYLDSSSFSGSHNHSGRDLHSQSGNSGNGSGGNSNGNGGSGSNRTESIEGLPGIGVTLVVMRTSVPFCSISDVTIRVMPHS